MNSHIETPDDFSPKPFDIDGCYRITKRIAAFDETGIPYHKVELSNALQTVRANVYDSPYIDLAHQRYLELVYVAGEILEDNEVPLIELAYLRRADTHAEGLAPLSTLPLSLASSQRAISFLANIAGRIENPHLRRFVRANMDRSDRIELFLNVPASISYHHAYRGGLAVHTSEVVRNIIGMINTSEPDMPRDIIETAVVAALFHDIGKIRMYGLNGRPTEAIQLLEHDALTLELCADGLKTLDTHEPHLAMLLRHIWTCSSPGARYGKEPMHTIPRYLRDADAQSANADSYRVAKSSSKVSGISRVGKQRYWLV